MAKPMKTFELHYPMIQFLIIFILHVFFNLRTVPRFQSHEDVNYNKTAYYLVIQFYFVIVSHQCEDHFQNCTYLALTDACAKDSSWMTVHCGMSCNSCQGKFPFHCFQLEVYVNHWTGKICLVYFAASLPLN